MCVQSIHKIRSHPFTYEHKIIMYSEHCRIKTIHPSLHHANFGQFRAIQVISNKFPAVDRNLFYTKDLCNWRIDNCQINRIIPNPSHAPALLKFILGKNMKNIPLSDNNGICHARCHQSRHTSTERFFFKTRFSSCMLYRHNAAITAVQIETWFFGIIHCSKRPWHWRPTDRPFNGKT